jgi:hypothetical protein
VDAAQAQEVIQHVREIFLRATQPPRWPMYMRQVKQYVRAIDESFDERKGGFGTIVEFLRACQREGLFRLERDRKGILRVFPGASLQRPLAAVDEASQPQALTTDEQISVSVMDEPESADEAGADSGEDLGSDLLQDQPDFTAGSLEDAPVQMTAPDPSRPELPDKPQKGSRTRSPRAPRARKPPSSAQPAPRRTSAARTAAPRKRRDQAG